MAKVLNRIRQSIVYRIGVLMLLTVVVAIGSMVASYVISDAAENDAAVVNLSGSLRAMTYRSVVTASGGDRQATENLMEQIAARLEHIAAISEFPTDGLQPGAQNFRTVHREWREHIRPLLTSVASGENRIGDHELLAIAESFVERIDTLVLDYQHTAEKKVELLRVVQLSSLFATVTLVYFSLFSLSRSVEQPLRQLIGSCRDIARGNFRQDLQLHGEDELGLLAATINRMGEVIDNTHRELETRVRDKTAQLQRSHEVLDFQYRLARRISEGPLDGSELGQWMTEFSRLTGLDDLDLCLMTPEGMTPYQHLIHGSGNNTCEESNCDSCAHAEGPVQADGRQIYRFPLEADKRNYGVLVCTLAQGQLLQREQQQRLSAFADAVTTAITLKERSEQDRRVALMDERGIIARELHDSLAQSLSYLKIQVARLARCNNGDTLDRDQVTEITAELKQGLNASYRQLRELLTTFRLQIAEGGLRGILEKSVSQYREQHPEIDIELAYDLEEIPLTPNEEIHLLQLVREASQNAVYHSRGNNISISLAPGEQWQIRVDICDNGVGISESPEKRNHFGMSIMQERASNLGGELDIRRREGGGTEVSFQFVPEYARDRRLLWNNAVGAGS